MIDLAATRARLREVLSTVTVTYPGAAAPEPITVHEWAVHGPVRLPAVFVGLPEIEFSVQPCIDKTTIGVAVAVARSGVSDTDTHQQLEELWPKVAEALTDAIPSRFGDLAANATVSRADFMPIGLQGQTHPAYELEIDFYG